MSQARKLFSRLNGLGRRTIRGCGRVLRTVLRVNLVDLFFLSVWPAWALNTVHDRGWFPWWMIAGSVAVWLFSIYNIGLAVERAFVTIGYPGWFKFRGQSYVVTNIVHSSDGTIRVEGQRKSDYVRTMTEFRAAGL